MTYVDPAGIETVETISVNENAPMWSNNLAGQLVKIKPNFKGVVIQNGKKFINK
ncbi:hypothetical protein [Prevotella corporis]|uniref:hypothetical protein n=1 Tax=Prevotella corporis TaxID=28128 RepID=UPI0023650C40|nr:hypothetical protein [Prevotella corporis]